MCRPPHIEGQCVTMAIGAVHQTVCVGVYKDIGVHVVQCVAGHKADEDDIMCASSQKCVLD